MIGWRSLSVHLVALGASSALALFVWTRKDPAATGQKGDVEVWGGSADRVELLRFEADNRHVRLERRKDSRGLWYVGQVEKTIEVRPPTSADAGADAGADATSSVTSSPEPEKKKETVSFVSVEQGKKLCESLAPLRALRRLGKIEEARAAEFGFDKSEGILHVVVGGKEHTLVFGGSTPGGSDRYAKDETGEVFALSGNIAQSLQFAESRLVERNLHEFQADELKSVKIIRGTLSRELVRVEDKKDGWADVATPTSLDETAGNWMTKLDRLRITTFVENPSPPLAPESTILRVEFRAKGGRELGYLELYKLPGEAGKAKYLAKTEHTRWYAEVLASAAEQVEQDLGSVVKAP